MEASSQKRLSLDTNILFDLADEKDFVLAETAVEQIPLIVSSDHHLLDIDHDTLRDACAEADLHPAFPVSPRRLLRALR